MRRSNGGQRRPALPDRGRSGAFGIGQGGGRAYALRRPSRASVRRTSAPGAAKPQRPWLQCPEYATRHSRRDPEPDHPVRVGQLPACIPDCVRTPTTDSACWCCGICMTPAQKQPCCHSASRTGTSQSIRPGRSRLSTSSRSRGRRHSCTCPSFSTSLATSYLRSH